MEMIKPVKVFVLQYA